MLNRKDTPKTVNFKRGLELLTILSLLFAVCLLPLTPSTILAAAQITVPDFEMQPVFKGWHRDREWVVLDIKLKNGAQMWRGQVSTTLTYAPGNEYSYSREVSLAANEQTQFFFYFLPTRYEPHYDIVLRDFNGQVVATKQLELDLINRTDYLIGVLTNSEKLNSNLLPKPGIIKVGTLERRTIIIPLTPADLPDQSETLRTLDALLLADLDYKALTATQWRTLESWVEEGGHLWLSGGANYQQLSANLNPALVPAQTQARVNAGQLTILFLPDNLRTVLTLANSEIQQLKLQVNTFVISRQEGDTLDGWPLVVSRPVGRGVVVATAFDLLQPPFSEMGKAASIWEALVYNTTTDQGYVFLKQELFEKDFVPRQLVKLPPPEKISLFWLVLILAGGWLIAGVGSLVLFKKFGRALLSISASGLLLVAALVLSWQIGASLTTRSVNLSRVSFLSFYAENIPVAIRTFNLSTYPDSQEYNLKFESQPSAPAGWLYRPQQIILPVSQTQAIPPQFFAQGEQAGFAPVRSSSNQGKNVQSFTGHSNIQGTLPIEASLAVLSDGRGLIGSLKNNSAWDLKEVVLVLGNNYLALGNMARGDYRQVLFNFSNRANFLPSQSIDAEQYGVDSKLDDQSQWLNKLRWTSLNAAYLSGQFAPMYQNSNLYFTAWLDDEAATKLVGGVKTADNLPLQMRDYALLIKPLPFGYQANDNQQKIIVPSASLASTNLNAVNVSYATDGSAKISNGGSVLLQYRLPTQVAFTPTRLSVLIKARRGDDSQTQYNPALEIYNWTRQSWETIANQDDKRNRIDLTGAIVPAYIEPGGNFIRLRATVKQGFYTIQQLNIELEGKRL